MSATATAWAVAQDPGSPGAKLLLMVLGNAADSDGVTFVGRKRLAAECCCRPETTSAHFAKLEELGLIARIERRRQNGSKTSPWIILAPNMEDRGPLLEASLEDRPNAVAAVARESSGAKSSPDDSAPGQVGISGGPDPTGEKQHPSSSAETHEATTQVILDLNELPVSAQADAAALLKAKTKVGGRVVTPAEMAIAAAALAEFNAQAGSDFGLGAHLTPIVGRIRERPSFGAPEHVRLVQSAWRLRWWERNGNGRRATPAVVYGNAGVFEQVIADATDEKQGKKPPGAKSPAKRFVRKGPRIGSPERPL